MNADGYINDMTLFSWLSVVGVCCLGAMSPGPSLAVVIQHTMRGSRKNGMAAGISHSLGVGVHATLTVTGLAAVLLLQPNLHKFITVCGGLYLAWLGWKSLRSNGAGFGGRNVFAGNDVTAAIRDGFMMSLLNPKLLIFFLALFSQFVAPEMGLQASIVMVLTAIGIDAGWYCLVATVLSHGDYLEKLNMHARLIDRTTGVIFLALALRVVTL